MAQTSSTVEELSRSVDLVVVGGGAAGLAAAVAAQQRGLTCQVLEAQDRLGGRIHTVDSPVGAIDLGAQLVNGDMEAVLALAAAADEYLSTLPGSGAAVTVTGRGRQRRLADDRPQDWLEELGDYRGRLPGAGTVADAIAAVGLTGEEAALARTVAAELLGQPAEVLDGEALRRELATYASDRDDGEFQLRGGFGRIVAALAGQLHRPPVTSEPVEAVRSDGEELLVETAAGRWRARYVVVAVPPPVARRIRFEIPEAAALAGLCDAFIPGDLIKFHVVYARPFWRYEGLSGRADFVEPLGLTVVDGSPDGGQAPRLVAFLGGATARTWAAQPAPWRLERLRHQLAAAFGPAAAAAQAIHEAVWVDHRWCGGAYNSQVRAGAHAAAADDLAAWGERVVFAGAELAPRFRGYVEGAIASGRAAVARLAAARQF